MLVLCAGCIDGGATPSVTPSSPDGSGSVSPSVSVTTGGSDPTETPTVLPSPSGLPEESNADGFTPVSAENGTFVYENAATGESFSFTVTYESGTENAFSVSGTTLTFAGFTEDSVYTLTGTLYGNVVVSSETECELELSLAGFTLLSYTETPIVSTGPDKLTISAKKDTENAVYDQREAVSDDDKTAIKAAIYADGDMNLQGKGSLAVYSQNNNGVHAKGDLKVKNLTLSVSAEDNALKGNDSVTITSGTVTLNARSGDGIKTKNSDLSAKGKQRGTVTISGGNVTVLALLDGIDAAYNVVICEESETLTLSIFTAKYAFPGSANAQGGENSNSSGGSSSGSSSGGSSSGGGTTSLNAGNGSGGGSSTGSVSTFAGGFPGGGGNPGGGFPGGGTPGGFPGGGGNPGGNPGNPDSGNTNKSDVSAKGIKAANRVTVSGGTIAITAYDDALHANGGETLENGETSVGDVEISGGMLTLFSADDGVHADGTATVSGGNIRITGSYEGVEGNVVEISGGRLSVISSDDGINGTGTSGNSIVISGGEIYVLAGGDGLDSNSRTSYGGIVFSGGSAVVFSYGQSDSAIDTESGYAYTGGTVLAVGLAGGMSGETTTSSPSFSTIGTGSTLRITEGTYLTVEGVFTVRVPVTMNALVAVLGKTGAGISAASSSDLAFDPDGVYRY